MIAWYTDYRVSDIELKWSSWSLHANSISWRWMQRNIDEWDISTYSNRFTNKTSYYQNRYFVCQGKFYRPLPSSKHSNRKSVWFELVQKWPDLGKRNVSETLKLRRNSHVLEWRHNERDGVSNHQLHDCLLNSLFKTQIKASTKAPRHWPLCG